MLTNVVTGKRYIKQLVEDGIVDGWDDPRLVSIAALRRRGFTPESIKMFVELCGISKSNSSVDYAMLEYCIREDLKAKKPRLMAVLDPIKVIIDNYPEDQVEWFDVVNNVECPELRKQEKYHSVRKSILTAMTLWKSHLRNILDYSLVMK